LRGLGEVVDETRVVKKILHVLPKQYNQIVVSIETLLNINMLMVEELVGRLHAAEDRLDVDIVAEKTEKLFLSEDQWLAKYRHRLTPEGSSSGTRGDRQGGFSLAKPKNMSQGEKKEPVVKLTSQGTPRRKGRCHNCGIYGHWKQNCKRPRKERREEAHHVKADDEQPMLMLATVDTVCTVTPWREAELVGVHVPLQVVHLNEERAFLADHDDDTWVLDMGASNNMTGCRAVLKSLDTSVGGTVRFGDGSLVEIKGMGSLLLQTRNKGHKVLTSVYFIPKLKSNIVSLGQLEERGYKIVIENGFCNLYDVYRCLLDRAPGVKNCLYLLKMQLATPVCLVPMKEDKAWLWHGRYGHLNFRALRDLSSKKIVEGMLVIDRVEEFCDGCALGKHHRHAFLNIANYRAEKPLDLVHIDLCGQIRPSTPGGKNYFLLVVDDFSRYMWLELLVTKAEAFECFKRVKAMAEVESGCRLRAFRSDRRGEFNSIQFTEFCNEKGLKHFTTAPYSPQQNVVVERRNQTIVEMARCMLKSKKIPSEFWGEAVHTVVYLLNRDPTRSLEGMTPYEAWHKKKPNVGHLRTFDCVAHVKKIGPGVTKLSNRSTQMVFVGYETGTKGYQVYDPVTKKLQVSHDVVFEEHRGWSWGEKNQDRSTETGVEVEFYYILGRTTISDNVQDDLVDSAGQPAVAPRFSVMDAGSPTQNST
jgi:hypothetical protein